MTATEKSLTLNVTAIPVSLKRRETEEERSLIRAAQQGDRMAFRQLVETYEHRTYTVAWRMVGNEDDARDITQDVFIRVYRFLPNFNRKTKFFTWLYRIIINTSYDYLRKHRKFQLEPIEEKPLKSTAPTPDRRAEKNEFWRSIYALLDYLSTPQKTAFILREIEHFSYREIAKIMDCPEGTTRSHLHYARSKLKKLILTHYPEMLETSHHEM